MRYLLSLLVLTFAVQAQAGRLEDLSWLEGKWVSTEAGPVYEETITSPAGGLILGMAKLTQGDSVLFFEYFQIAQEGASLVLRPLPMGNPGAPFVETSGRDTQLVFENPKNEFPSKIAYSLYEGKLLITVEGTEAGKPKVLSFLLEKR